MLLPRAVIAMTVCPFSDGNLGHRWLLDLEYAHCPMELDGKYNKYLMYLPTKRLWCINSNLNPSLRNYIAQALPLSSNNTVFITTGPSCCGMTRDSPYWLFYCILCLLLARNLGSRCGDASTVVPIQYGHIHTVGLMPPDLAFSTYICTNITKAKIL